MALFLAFLVFVVVVAVVTFAGMKMYVRPKEAMERVEFHPAVSQGRDGDAAPADPSRHPQ